METIPTDRFVEWCAARHIQPDDRYSPPECLVYVPPCRHHRFWPVPERAAEIPFFASHLLAGFDPWAECFAWPRGGVWPDWGSSERIAQSVQDVILRGAGVPPDLHGAVRFTRDELPKLVTVIFAKLAFGWSVIDDLFVVPDHGRQFLQTDHHDVVHVEFSDSKYIAPFIKHMADEDYALPTELPDATFKKPDWM